jgi:hypothetical protein
MAVAPGSLVAGAVSWADQVTYPAAPTFWIDLERPGRLRRTVMDRERPPLRFFFPRPKVDRDSQTTVIFNAEPLRESIVIRMRTAALTSLISQDPRPATQADVSYMLDFGSQVGFMAANYRDVRFDTLTPPPTLFEELPIGFCTNFYDGGFEYTLPDGGRPIFFEYARAVIPLIESLETGVVSRELVIVLRKNLQLDSATWEEGRILALIKDFRSKPPAESRRLLQVADDVIAYCVTHRRQPPLLEAEKQIINLVHPVICVDPSPDVARVQSVIDWRNKLWKDRSDRHGVVGRAEKASPPVIETTGKVTLSPLRAPITIPESIVRFIGGPFRGVKS